VTRTEHCHLSAVHTVYRWSVLNLNKCPDCETLHQHAFWLMLFLFELIRTELELQLFAALKLN